MSKVTLGRTVPVEEEDESKVSEEWEGKAKWGYSHYQKEPTVKEGSKGEAREAINIGKVEHSKGEEQQRTQYNNSSIPLVEQAQPHPLAPPRHLPFCLGSASVLATHPSLSSLLRRVSRSND